MPLDCCAESARTPTNLGLTHGLQMQTPKDMFEAVAPGKTPGGIQPYSHMTVTSGTPGTRSTTFRSGAGITESAAAKRLTAQFGESPGLGDPHRPAPDDPPPSTTVCVLGTADNPAGFTGTLPGLRQLLLVTEAVSTRPGVDGVVRKVTPRRDVIPVTFDGGPLAAAKVARDTITDCGRAAPRDGAIAPPVESQTLMFINYVCT
jgi:hypothetical protein